MPLGAEILSIKTILTHCNRPILKMAAVRTSENLTRFYCLESKPFDHNIWYAFRVVIPDDNNDITDSFKINHKTVIYTVDGLSNNMLSGNILETLEKGKYGFVRENVFITQDTEEFEAIKPKLQDFFKEFE